VGSHTPWTDRLEDVLTRIGVKSSTRRLIQDYQARLCAPRDKSPLLVATPRIQGVMTGWGIGAQEQYDVIEYLDMLNSRLDEFAQEREDEKRVRLEESRREHAARKRQQRDENREDYNEYQREYMREYRARKKATTKVVPLRKTGG
jgi:hypothetical protein